MQREIELLMLALQQRHQREVALLEMQERISARVRSEMDKGQREFLLRQQMRTIQTELGEIDDTEGEVQEYADLVERRLSNRIERLEGVAQVQIRGMEQAQVRVVECESQVGSGALALAVIPSAAVSITLMHGHSDRKLRRLAAAFRSLPVPVVGRIDDGALSVRMTTELATTSMCSISAPPGAP